MNATGNMQRELQRPYIQQLELYKTTTVNMQYRGATLPKEQQHAV